MTARKIESRLRSRLCGIVVTGILMLAILPWLTLIGCGGKSPTSSAPPPEIYKPVPAAGSVELPKGTSVDENSLTITAGAFAQATPDTAGNVTINLNEGATQLVSATTTSGDPILLSIAVNPHSGTLIDLNPRTTAEAMIFLNPAAVVSEPSLSFTVMGIVRNMAETQTLADVIASKIAANPSVLVTDDPDIKAALTNALIQFVSRIDSLTANGSVPSTLREEINRFRELKHYKEIDQKGLAQACLQVGNLIISPAGEQSGVSVSAANIDATNYKITLTNSKKRYVGTYLDDANTGVNIGSAFLHSRKNLLSWEPMAPFSIELSNNLDLSRNPQSILRAYSIGANDLSALTSAPSWQSRCARPIIFTGVLDFFVPLMQVVTGVKSLGAGDNWLDTPGGTLGRIIQDMDTAAFGAQLGLLISDGDYTEAIYTVFGKAVRIVIGHPDYVVLWLEENGLGILESTASSAMFPLRIMLLVTSGFELGSAVYDFATSSWLVSFTLSSSGPVPTPPTLSFPPNGATDVQISVTLTWLPSESSTTYRGQVSTDVQFSHVVYDSSTTLTHIGPVGLSNASKYYWRVNASNGQGTSGWSAVWSFTCEDVGPNPQLCVYPSSVGIGDVYSGVPSARRQVVVKNCGGGTLGGQFSKDVPWILISPGGPFSIPAGDSVIYTVWADSSQCSGSPPESRSGTLRFCQGTLPSNCQTTVDVSVSCRVMSKCPNVCDEPGGTCASTQCVMLSGSMQDDQPINPAGDADCYKIDVTAGKWLHNICTVISKTAGVDLNPVIDVYSPSGTLLTHKNDYGEGMAEEAWTQCTVTGTYCVRITDASGNGGSGNNYKYDLTFRCEDVGP